MTNILKQLPSGPNLDILRFLGDDSKALGGLKVACTTYERNISRLEEVAHPVLGLRHLLVSKKPATVFAGIKRLGEVVDLPSRSFSAVLALKDIILLENHIYKPLDSFEPVAYRRMIKSLLSLISKVKTTAIEEDRLLLLKSIVLTIRMLCVDEPGPSALADNLELFLEILPLIGSGDSQVQHRLRRSFLRLLVTIYGNKRHIINNHGLLQEQSLAANAILEKIHSNFDSITELLVSLGDDNHVSGRFIWEVTSYAYMKMVHLKGDDSFSAMKEKVYTLLIYQWCYRQQTSLGIKHNLAKRYVNPVMECIEACPEGHSYTLSTLRMHISRILHDVAKEGDEQVLSFQCHLGLIGKLKMQVGSGTETQKETLSNIEGIIEKLAQRYSQMPYIEYELSKQIKGETDEATKVILTDLLAIIKRSESLGGGGGSKGGGGGGSK